MQLTLRQAASYLGVNEGTIRRWIEQRALPAGDLAALNNSFGFGGHNVAIAFRSA